MPDHFSYTVQVVDYPEGSTPAARAALEIQNRETMGKHGWKVIGAAHDVTHTAITYRRPAGLNSVYFILPNFSIIGTSID